jgi:hypothetical protein
MGKRRYHQPHWWFNTRLEHMPTGSFWYMFLCLSACQATASAPLDRRRRELMEVQRDYERQLYPHLIDLNYQQSV